MSYFRVIPRDLFNEASLLKCYGRLYILLDRINSSGATMSHDDMPFDVIQPDEDGSITVQNVKLFVNRRHFELWRPLNSREPWPLYAEDAHDPDCDPVEVFTDGGEFTGEFLALIGAEG